jgi:MoxR-like ATPase
MQLRDILSCVRTVWSADLAVMLWGPPGVGKSDGVRQLAASMSYRIPESPGVAAASPRLAKVYGREFTGRKVFDVRLLLCDPTDLKGLPVYSTDDRRAVWVMTGLFPVDPKQLANMERELLMLAEQSPPDFVEDGIEARRKIAQLEDLIESALHDQHSVVFLDELAAAPPAVQQSAYQLVLDRKIGEYSLPRGTSIIAASNQSSHQAGVHNMPSPLKSRFIHYVLDAPSFEQWRTDFAEPRGIAESILGFLKFKEDAFFNFDPKKMRQGDQGDVTYACPRTWEFADRILRAPIAAPSLEGLETTLAGTIGSGTASEFVAHMKLFSRLPDPNEVLDGRIKEVDFRNPDTGQDDLSLRFAFLTGLTRRLKANPTLPRADNYVNYILDNDGWKQVEFAVVILKECLQTGGGSGPGQIILKAKRWPDLGKLANLGHIITTNNRAA